MASAQWAAPGWAGAGYAGYAPAGYAGYAGHAWAAPSPWAYAPAYGAGAWGLAALPNGAVVPLDEPSVAAARADHLSHYAGPPVAAFLADEPAVAEAKAAAIAALDAPLVPVRTNFKPLFNNRMAPFSNSIFKCWTLRYYLRGCQANNLLGFP